jgi:hypothetical protein
MSQGLKNLQTAARSASRRDRMLDTSNSTAIHTPLTSSSISHPGSSTHGVPTYGAYEHHDDSGYADDLEAEYDADNASDRSSNANGYVQGHYHTHSASSAGSINGMGGMGGGYGGQHGQSRVSSMDMGIDAIINRPGNGR